ncbi:hypothetical protein FDI40_gp311 [Agrobacterium phage Atu_ph07]|uniref:Uncharacterized protein n=1 Tax=Agrobacterium phage Atu_ph07 TaxID=2024264 RepID=A0A2L0UZY1_9CAUD|nr:hypothetical protein FDI40_gp311 [Agrobacterium phage Atu_ph07]AUZ95076.1 hypothetical protein [Agrobacterium phage Atu_ph07]
MKTIYMVITHIHKDTNLEGKVVENMRLYDTLPKANILTSASLIFDLFNGKVIKNRFEEENDNPFIDYVSRYREEIGKFIAAWAQASPENMAAAKAMFGGGNNDE